ncbi:hypothetical protein AX17_004303 [Amanita inopinata Kibby_2008]|nr:hypothetical protein AX17_004303 [Amanita inopinata Kibby_2008]
MCNSCSSCAPPPLHYLMSRPPFGFPNLAPMALNANVTNGTRISSFARSHLHNLVSFIQSLSTIELSSLIVSVLLLSILLGKLSGRTLHTSNPNRLPYPPGPKPLPILGNMFDLGREHESAHYFKMAQKYGNLVFMSVLGKNLLFVNNFQTANELFEKRGSNYSDRARSPMINDLMGWDWSFGHMRYGERWKTHRKMFHRQFQQSVAPTHWPVQLREAHTLLRHLLHSPQDLINHLRHNAASTIMSVTYGITVSPKDDRYITVAEKALEGMAKAANPGAFLVEVIPALKYVPEWFPGAGFKKKAREWKRAVMEMRDAPFAEVAKGLKEGTASPCFVSNLVTDLDSRKNVDKEKEMETIKGCAGLAYAAGAESTVSALSSFILAMVIHPSIQIKARQELDTVVGRGRLPDFTDRDSLPYINAIVKEVLRWNPVAPLGLPHMTTNDDEYNGYFIPASTIVVGNSWAILHDPDTFPEPHLFNPDRFLRNPKIFPSKASTGSPSKTNIIPELSPSDPLSSAFGYGRRICPGRFMAEAQLWVSIACILSVFTIGKGVDEEGKEVDTVPEFSSGMICHPLPFKFSIKPRGDWVKPLIEQTVDLVP